MECVDIHPLIGEFNYFANNFKFGNEHESLIDYYRNAFPGYLVPPSLPTNFHKELSALQGEISMKRKFVEIITIDSVYKLDTFLRIVTIKIVVETLEMMVVQMKARTILGKLAVRKPELVNKYGLWNVDHKYFKGIRGGNMPYYRYQIRYWTVVLEQCASFYDEDDPIIPSYLHVVSQNCKINKV